MKYADVSNANLYYGNMRFDVNVSVSKTDTLGTRTETKNLNSFRSVEKAVEYEVIRQIKVLEEGGEIVQETRGWDDAKLQTFSQRSKENAHDYRYFPDPDLPPIVLTDDYIAEVKASMPALPADYRQAFATAGIDPLVAEDIIAVPETAKTVKRIYDTAGADHAKRVAFWLMQPQSDDIDPTASDFSAVIPSEAEESRDISERDFSIMSSDSSRDDKLVRLSQMVQDNKLSSTAAKEVLAELLKTNEDPEAIATTKNLLQVSDEAAIIKIVDQVLAANDKAAQDVRTGEMKAIGFLVGQVMKLSQGKANPALATELIKKQLGL